MHTVDFADSPPDWAMDLKGVGTGGKKGALIPCFPLLMVVCHAYLASSVGLIPRVFRDW